MCHSIETVVVPIGAMTTRAATRPRLRLMYWVRPLASDDAWMEQCIQRAWRSNSPASHASRTYVYFGALKPFKNVECIPHARRHKPTHARCTMGSRSLAMRSDGVGPRPRKCSETKRGAPGSRWKDATRGRSRGEAPPPPPPRKSSCSDRSRYLRRLLNC